MRRFRRQREALLDNRTAAAKRAQQIRFRRLEREPVHPGLRSQEDDLAVMAGGNIGARFGGQHRDRAVPDETGDPEDRSLGQVNRTGKASRLPVRLNVSSGRHVDVQCVRPPSCTRRGSYFPMTSEPPPARREAPVGTLRLPTFAGANHRR